MAALPTLASVKGLFERTLKPFAASNEALLLAVTFFWAEGRRDPKSLVQAERVIATGIERATGRYQFSSKQGGAMLLRSISRKPIPPYLKGDWDCWLVPELPVSNVDVAAKIGEAAAAMTTTSLITVQLGHRMVICERMFLLASLPTVLVRYLQAGLHWQLCGAD